MTFLNLMTLVSKGVRTSGEYPYYGANGIQDYIDNNIFDGTFILIGKDGSVINKDGTPVVNWAKGKIILRPYQDYLNGYDEEGRHFMGYVEVVNKLLSDFKLGTDELWGENKEKEFIKLMGLLLKLRNILTTFDEFVDPLSKRQLQDFSSEYADLYDKYRKKKDGELEEINDDVVFEIELLKQIEVNIDYILI